MINLVPKPAALAKLPLIVVPFVKQRIGPDIMSSNRMTEAKQCAEERYTLWAMNHVRNPGSVYAAFALIQSCLHIGEFEDAHNYARHAMFMINDMADNFIPSDKRSLFLAEASYHLATAIFNLAKGWRHPTGREAKSRRGSNRVRTPVVGDPFSAEWNREC